jgi:phage terminase large subunit-like protein
VASRPKTEKLSPETRERLAQEILAFKAANEPRNWETDAYNKQLPPDHPRHHLPDPRTGKRCGCDGANPDWQTWLLMTGRGFGKTRTGANWAVSRALSEPGIWVAVCGPTFADVKNTCFEGPSGIKNVAQPGEIIDHNKNDLRITLRNGSIIQGFSAEKPESIRGSNLAYCWFDEMGIIRYPEFYEAGLLPALRVSKGQLMITTTPRNTKLLREIMKEAETNPRKVHFTHATSAENWKAGGVTEMIERVTSKFEEGSFLERQELQGEFIAEVPGALFQMEWFDKYRVAPDEVPDFRRVVVAVDPASSSSFKSDETGISVCGEGEDRNLYTLQDCSLQGTPDQVMDVLIGAFHRWNADLVVGEKNGVGDYFKGMLYNKNPYIPFKSIQAMNSKKIRAQPISPLTERGQVHMVGNRSTFEELERQLCALTAYDDRVKAHDDRADAWVYAMRELCGFAMVNYKEIYGFSSCKGCGEDVHILKDKVCRRCGAAVDPTPPQRDPKHARSAVRWASAYNRTCPQGHEYPMKLGKCPECSPDPNAYLAQIAAFTSAGNQGSRTYTGRNWLAGRRI